MERKEIVVVDTSVIVKWFVEEEYSKNVRLLRDSYVNGLIDLTAPSLLSYEVINTLKFSGAFGEEELAEIAKILDYYQINTYDLRGELAFKTIEISCRKGVSIYDAAYVALSYLLDTILYTADEKLIQKIKDPTHVKHIYEYSV